jgi:hypothetical protein
MKWGRRHEDRGAKRQEQAIFAVWLRYRAKAEA